MQNIIIQTLHVPHPHNFAIQLLSETGILVFLSLFYSKYNFMVFS